ncbi:unnamed protein product [Caenorhabditis bovis]|uniref:Uncharacterized protein n=1 Tax=Caenorhabditis bovis TaxID=2654633 RepID=A0A8S1F5B3_9PELO|nr:unnamed protein product [Caenorhabditis bovis]
MFAEVDEGYDKSPSSTSYVRNYPTFVADEDGGTFIEPQKSIMMFPQRLDLSSLNHNKTETRIKNHSKSYLKDDSDLKEYKKKLKNVCGQITRKLEIHRSASLSSSTSDRGSSISTQSSTDHRSLTIEIERAKRLIKRIEKPKLSDTRIFDDSHFRLADEETDEDETRPPSSESSLCYHEMARASQRQLRDVISELTDVGVQEAENARRRIRCDAATNTSVVLTEDDIRRFNGGGENRTLRSSSSSAKDSIREAFETFGIENDETPILRTNQSNNGSERIEVARNASSVHNLNTRPRIQKPLHHSLSSMAIAPARVYIDQDHNRSLPLIPRFTVKQSTRDIFKEPLDIDNICGKGLRRNPKSSVKIFGGAQVAQTVHGVVEKPSSSRGRSRNVGELSARATVASSAKHRSVSKGRAENQNPPYCSATQKLNGVAHSIGTVGQQLIGTIKSLFPDLLALGHRILREPSETDVAVVFRDELRRQLAHIERKYRENCATSDDESDEMLTKLGVVERVREKLDLLLLGGGQRSRVQQLKLINSALLSA